MKKKKEICRTGNNEVTVLTLLDLSVAFDSTDHSILLQLLHFWHSSSMVQIFFFSRKTKCNQDKCAFPVAASTLGNGFPETKCNQDKCAFPVATSTLGNGFPETTAAFRKNTEFFSRNCTSTPYKILGGPSL